METKEKVKSSKGFQLSAGLVILVCITATYLNFEFNFGAEKNFHDNGHPANIWGTIYMGGIVVPIIQGLFLTVIVLSIERFIALKIANGKGSLVKFVQNIKASLAESDIESATELCTNQKGSVANVVSSTLIKYEQMQNATDLTKEQKLITIQKEIEEATALELPSLEQNLGVVATMTTLGTLLGLLGTVVGMIKSFSALAAGGAADSMALSAGISEALINTAFGIATGALAVISYNFFTSKIDKITYCIDEVGFSIVQSYSASHN